MKKIPSHILSKLINIPIIIRIFNKQFDNKNCQAISKKVLIYLHYKMECMVFILVTSIWQQVMLIY